MKTRLGKRLSTLFKSIHAQSTVIYDLCCDHGALGRATLETRPNAKVFFNDVHKDIMARLADQLDQFGAQNYDLLVCSGTDIVVQPTLHGSIVLAGVGDELCIAILEALLRQESLSSYEIIISPANKTAHVRHYLNQQAVALIHETTVTEKKRTYEVITVRPSKKPNILVSKFGDCWQEKNSDHVEHVRKLISFYKAGLNAKHTDKNRQELIDIIDGYQSILKKIQ